MNQATLCLLINEKGSPKEILLAMKKRGFGAGKWNGVGGKPDRKKGDKNIIDTAVRETKEEIGVEISGLEKMAVLDFYFPYKSDWDQQVSVFFAKNWQGQPKETEEMLPRWFKYGEIPYNKMWDDDKFWLPEVLAGKKIKAEFIFKEGEMIDKRNVKIVEQL